MPDSQQFVKGVCREGIPGLRTPLSQRRGTRHGRIIRARRSCSSRVGCILYLKLFSKAYCTFRQKLPELYAAATIPTVQVRCSSRKETKVSPHIERKSMKCEQDGVQWLCNRNVSSMQKQKDTRRIKKKIKSKKERENERSGRNKTR
jgi:hypothetical protein